MFVCIDFYLEKMLHLDMKEILFLLFPAEEKSFRGLPFSGGPEIEIRVPKLFCVYNF